MSPEDDPLCRSLATLILLLTDQPNARQALDKLLVSLQQLIHGNASISHVRGELEQLLRLLLNVSVRQNNGCSSLPTSSGSNGSSSSSSVACNASSSAYSSDCSPLSSLVECNSLCPLSGSLSSSSLPVDATKNSGHNSSSLVENANNGRTNDSESRNSSQSCDSGGSSNESRSPENHPVTNNVTTNRSVPPPPPPPPMSHSLYANLAGRTDSNGSTATANGMFTAAHLLPNTPKPRSRMKTLNWSKIPAQRVLCNKNSVWSQLLCNTIETQKRKATSAQLEENKIKQPENNQKSETSKEMDLNSLPLDFDTLERLFCQNAAYPLSGSAPNSCPNSPRTSRRLHSHSNGNGTLASAVGHALNGYSVNGNHSFWGNNSGNNSTNNQNCFSSSHTTNGHHWSTNHHSSSNGSNMLSNNLSSFCLNNGSSELGDHCNPSPYASLERRIRNSDSMSCNGIVGNVLNDCSLPAQMLDAQRSLKVNIFLKQFRNEQQVLSAVRAGAADQLGAERLLHLLRLLPDDAELEMLCSVEELGRLPPAERFLVKLLAIPSSRLRIECMLLKEEYESNFAHLRPSLDTLIQAGKDIQTCQKLHQVFYLILIAGNFLNWGGYAGEAAGFKMLSLLELSEIRANKPGVNLIHYVAAEAQKHLLLPLELLSVEQASKISVDALKSDINSLANKIFKLKHQLNGGKWPIHVLQPALLAQIPTQEALNEQFFEHMNEFLGLSETQVKQLTRKVETDLEQVRKQLGEFLCEDLSEFKLEDCFRIFSCFLSRLRTALDENERRRETELRQEQRKLSGSRISLHQTERSGMSNGNATNGHHTEIDLHKNQSTNGSTHGNPTQNGFSTNSAWNNSLPRHQRSFRNGTNSTIVSGLTGNGSDQLDGSLLELLTRSDIGQSAENLLFAGGSFRRLGSGRRSIRNSAVATTFSSENTRERSDCNQISENTWKKKIESDVPTTTNTSMTSNSYGSLQRKGSTQKISTQLQLNCNQSNSSNRLTDQSSKLESFDRFSRMRRSIRGSPLASPTGSKTALRSLLSINSGTNSNSGSTNSLSTSANLFDHGLQRDNLDRVQSSKDLVSLESSLLKPTVSYGSNSGGSNGGSSCNLLLNSRMGTSSHSSQLSIGTVIAASIGVNKGNSSCTDSMVMSEKATASNSLNSSQTTSNRSLQRQATFVGGSLLTGLKNSLAQLLPKECKEKPPKSVSHKQVKARVQSTWSNSSSLMANNHGHQSTKQPNYTENKQSKQRQPIKCDTNTFNNLDGQMRLQLQSLAPATRTTLNRTSLLRMSLNSRLNKQAQEQQQVQQQPQQESSPGNNLCSNFSNKSPKISQNPFGSVGKKSRFAEKTNKLSNNGYKPIAAR